MCVDGNILDSRISENYETNMFFIFGCGFKIKVSVMHEHVMNNQKHMENAYEHLRISRTFKHIQGN